MERLALKKLLTWIAPRLSGERSIRRAAFSADVRRGIERYLFGPTYRQLREEIGDVPEDMTFVFGHTHKPFEAVLEDPNRQKTLKVYNTGGWPIDSREPFEQIGGSILFMNERLDAASLRVFNDAEAGENVSLQVRRASADPRGSELAEWLETRLRDGSRRKDELAEPWHELKARIAGAINQRRRLYKESWG